ncbi:MAG: aromatic ring-hydroxylating dioxygenase subunit alpha, partial [Gammaproteobacteria bacterium]|nr:aromatic ring-hydroxylating dioxygenase subunit alpha [Gammaproteobacteria bacterium]NIT64443.1 aromatic ring-hydroxylating dioxygenase subunit alpha [Gammaproteobacteria bacterium]NIV21355.1 Rieske 2Fe-2S domain-containing protein [Gammaproteobacteria bacterium]NIY33023.1 Rieske 2Fe-2S domain-containing protein [Gammaproteobacteria bacterium]
MDRDTQIALGRHLLHCLRQPQDSLQGEISYNDKSIYVDEAQWRQERDVLFRRYPLVAAASCQLRQPGDFVAEDLAGTPVLVVRARDGDVRAFLNVCAHRGAAVVEEPCGEARRTFACPYHGWVYDTDGRLVSIPQQGFGFEGLSLEGLRLVPLPAAERHGLVFVLPDPTGTLDLDAYLGALGPELAGYGFGAYHHFETVVRTPEVNWKLVADGFWEAYHI